MSETNRNRRSAETGRASSARKTSSGRTSQGSRSGRARQSSSDRILAVQNARSRSSAGSSRQGGRRRRRRQRPDVAKILLILIGVAIVILCIAVGVRSCARDGDPSQPAAETTTEPETELEAEITINGVSVHGLTKTDAKELILKNLGWGMTVTFEDETKELENLLESRVEEVINEAFSGGESGAFTVDTSGLEEQAKTQAQTLAAGWDVSPKNGSISSYDSASGDFVFASEENGRAIDQEKLASDILEAIEAGDYDRSITAEASVVEPEITAAEAKSSFKRLGTFTTTTTSNRDRNENIRLASAAINGVIIQPGEEFSFNLTTGNRTTDKGYRAAGAYVNGVLVEEPGGGVCQVSSTLYNAVVFAGLKTTERHAHSYEPSYVTPGEDAMVSYDGYQGPDMKFVNNSNTAVGIKTSFSNQKLTVSVYGVPILEEGVTLSMKSEKVAELDPPAPQYEEDQTLQPDEQVEVKAATPGSRWITNLVTTKNGEVISDTFLHSSTYNGKSATIRRNTSGVVIPAESESASEGETESSAADPTAESESGSPDASAPAVTAPAETETAGQGPGFEVDGNDGNESGAQNQGPGDVIIPSGEAGNIGDTSGPGGQAGPAGTSETISGPASVEQPETSSGPGDIGFIAPMG